MGDNRNSGGGIGRGLVLVVIGALLIALGFSWGGRWSGFTFNFSDIDSRGFHNPSWDNAFQGFGEGDPDLRDGDTIEDIADDWSSDDWSIEDLEEGPAAAASDRANDRGEDAISTQNRSGALTEDIDNVNIDLKYASLTIKTGSEAGYRTSGFAKDSLLVSASNGALRIRERDLRAKNFFGRDGYRPSVELILPAGKKVGFCSISVGAGTVDLRDLACGDFRLESGAGSITGINISADSSRLESGAGKLEFSGSSFTDARMSSGAGHIGFAGTLSGKTVVETGVGSIYLDLAGSDDDYRIRFERGLGSVKIGGESYNGIGNGTAGNADAASLIEVNTGIGEVHISFDGSTSL